MVVIVLLSILAATVLPRFMSADREAHAAIASSTLGAFLSSATLLHGEWLALAESLENPEKDDSVQSVIEQLAAVKKWR